MVAQAEPAPTPLGVVTGIYERYQATPDAPLGEDRIYSARLQKLLDADRAATPAGEIGKIDFDYFVDGQDWEIKELQLDTVSESGDRAQVRANFKNFDEPRQILIDLVREKDDWRVDEVQSTRVGGRWALGKILAGAPDAFPDENTTSPPEGAPD